MFILFLFLYKSSETEIKMTVCDTGVQCKWMVRSVCECRNPWDTECDSHSSKKDDSYAIESENSKMKIENIFSNQTHWIYVNAKWLCIYICFS